MKCFSSGDMERRVSRWSPDRVASPYMDGAPGPGLFYLELSHVQLHHSIITVIRLYLRQTANSKIRLEIFNRFSVLRFSNNPIEIDSERMSPVISR